MEQSIPKQTAGQNKAIGTELSHADAPGASLPGLRQTKPTLQLTAPSHKKDINLEGFFHCQSFTMLFPAPSVAEHQHPYFAFCSFLYIFFPLSLLFSCHIITKNWLCLSSPFLQPLPTTLEHHKSPGHPEHRAGAQPWLPAVAQSWLHAETSRRPSGLPPTPRVVTVGSRG